jgi:transcriptional regulator with XRE-family HTH domain
MQEGGAMNKPVGKLLQEKRRQKGYSAPEVAGKLGISVSNWYSIEYSSGARLSRMNDEFLKKLCRILDISFLELKKNIASHSSIYRINQKKTIAAYVKKSRLKLGFSQQELAARSRLSQVKISNIETGKTKYPQRATLTKLATALNCDPAELLKRAIKRVRR